MPASTRTTIDGFSYTSKQLEALYFLTQVDKATLDDIARYCQLTKATVVGHIDALQRARHVTSDGRIGGVATFYWCIDKAKAQQCLRHAPVGAIDPSKEVSVTEPSQLGKDDQQRVAGFLFSARELRVLATILAAQTPMSVSAIVEKGNFTTTVVRTALDLLLRKKLIIRQKGSQGAFVYSLKDTQIITEILAGVDKDWLALR